MNSSSTKETKALRYDEGKFGLEFIPMSFVFNLNEVYRFGAKKYSPNNWKKGMDWDKCYNSAHRHLDKWWSGETFDKESGLHHLLHAAWNILTLWWYEKNKSGKDTRLFKL